MVTKDRAEVTRPFEVVCDKGEREGDYRFKKGSTAIKSSKITKIEFDVVEEEVVMDED